ncbi:MAG: hypothetical protein NW200_05635 [Hyphomonadaceae bacterium]|nr:hypothetical protein [Hyphomonadaceae bacterium]
MKRFRFSGAGLMLASALLAAAALLSALAGETVAAHAHAAADRAASSLTVRVLSPDADAAVETAAEALRATPGVAFAAPITPARAAQLLEAAGGGPVDPADLPPLRLIEASRDPAEADDAAITAALAAAGVRADLIAAPAEPAPAAFWGRAGGLLGTLILGAALALVFHRAARADGQTAALGADLGAARGAILAAYGRSGAEFAFLTGIGAALVVVAGAAGVLSALPVPVSSAVMAARISPMEAAIVLLAPLYAAAAAAWGARSGAAAAFDAADRLG